MNVQELLTNPPKIHGSEEARTSIYRIEDAMFAFLDTYLREGMNTLEIGAGTSTIIFAIKKTRHTCIVPDLKQLWRIKVTFYSARVTAHAAAGVQSRIFAWFRLCSVK